MISFEKTKKSDIPYVMELENHPENKPYVAQWSSEMHEKAVTAPGFRHILICRENRPVGYCILSGLTNPHKSLEIVRLVVEDKDKGKGIGYTTLEMIKEYAFTTLRFHRLWLDVRDNNARAHYLYEKCGFTLEGKFREKVIVDGTYVSVYFLSILEQEYKETATDAAP